MNKLKVLVAENSGICFGVKRAFSLLEESTEEALKIGRRVVMLGPVIHNPRVISDYAERGVDVVDIDSVPANSVVVVRSHGVTAQTEQILQTIENVKIIDTTCPYVQRIHKLVAKQSAEGCAILVMGDKNHSEVEGITSRISGDFFVIHPSEFEGKEQELRDFLKNHKTVFAVAQTTSRPSNFEHLLKLSRGLVRDLPDHKILSSETICTATLKRQDSARELANRVDVMVVIGGKNSSNTSKLLQVVSEKNAHSFWVESTSDLTPEQLGWIKNAETVGITAGASTPDYQIDEIKSFLEKLNDSPDRS